MKSLTIPFLFALAILRLQAAGYPPPAEEEWDLAARKANQQFGQHQLAAAALSARQALRIAKHSGDSDNRVAITYFLLGNIYRAWGNCAEARTSYSHSITAWEKQANPQPQYAFNSIVNLLAALCECDQFDAVDKTFRKYERKLLRYQSGSPADEAELLSVRAMIARARKKYGEAETYYRRTIQLLEQTPGNNLRIEEERVNLALVIDKQGRHAEALAESEQVIAFLDRSGFSRPGALAGALNNAACSLADLGRWEESKSMFERAINVATEAFGEDSRFTAKTMLNYARALRETRQKSAAEAMQRKGAEAFRRALMRDTATVDAADLQ